MEGEGMKKKYYYLVGIVLALASSIVVPMQHLNDVVRRVQYEHLQRTPEQIQEEQESIKQEEAKKKRRARIYIQEQQLKNLAARENEGARRERVELALAKLKDPNPDVEADLKAVAFIKCMLPPELNTIIKSFQDKDYLWAKHLHAKQRVIVQLPLGQWFMRRSMQPSPNGKYLAFAYKNQRREALIKVIELNGLREILTKPMENVAFTPNIAWSADSQALCLTRVNPHAQPDEVPVVERIDLTGELFVGEWKPARENDDSCYIRHKFLLSKIRTSVQISPSKNIGAGSSVLFSNGQTVFLYELNKKLDEFSGNTPTYGPNCFSQIEIESPTQVFDNRWSPKGLYLFVNTRNQIIQCKPISYAIAQSMVRKNHPFKIAGILGAIGIVRKLNGESKGLINIFRKALLEGSLIESLCMAGGVSLLYDLASSEYDLFKKWRREKG